MRKVISVVGAALVIVAAAFSGTGTAFAAQVPCGNPTDTKVHLNGGAGARICFAGLGVNAFNKVGSTGWMPASTAAW